MFFFQNDQFLNEAASCIDVEHFSPRLCQIFVRLTLQIRQERANGNDFWLPGKQLFFPPNRLHWIEFGYTKVTNKHLSLMERPPLSSSE